MIQFSSDLMVVDVRTSGEFAQSHIEGAINSPLSDLPTQIGELDRNRPIPVYCHTGHRSAQAATILVNAGFTHIYDRDGGLNAWISCTGLSRLDQIPIATNATSRFITQSFESPANKTR